MLASTCAYGRPVSSASRRHSRVANCTTQLRSIAASNVATPSSPSQGAHSPAYAVIDVGGVKQYVEEGSSFACSKRALEEVSLGGTVRFQKVLALKHEGELLKGRPYLEGAVVEGRLEDEFRGPGMWSSMTTSSQSSLDDDEVKPERMLRRILITRIQG